ncbi:MAG: response regulator transcription factor [Saprospiraceae bacterium]|nr:response regulator transcription factor [Saprospiraceae bacterium]
MRNQIKALIIDDEPNAIHGLRNMLATYCPAVKVLASAENATEAYKLYQQLHPNLIFLDIELCSQQNGFDFVRMCQPQQFGVIITTSFQQYAIKAITDIQPWGYLVKPIDAFDLITSIKVAEKKVEAMTPPKKGLTVHDHRLGKVALLYNDILFFKAQNAAVDIVIWRNNRSKTLASYRTLKEFEEELPEEIFFRSHKSYLVNLAWVDRFERCGRTGLAHLRSGDTVEISAQKLDAFEAQFEIFMGGSAPHGA